MVAGHAQQRLTAKPAFAFGLGGMNIGYPGQRIRPMPVVLLRQTEHRARSPCPWREFARARRPGVQLASREDGETRLNGRRVGRANRTGNVDRKPQRITRAGASRYIALSDGHLHDGILMIMRMIVNYFYNGQGRKREKTSVNPF